MVYFARSTPLYGAAIDGPGSVAYDPLLKIWTQALARTSPRIEEPRPDIIDITDRLTVRANVAFGEKLAHLDDRANQHELFPAIVREELRRSASRT